MTIEEILDQIASKEFRLNNLFQRTDGQWMANLRSVGGFFFEYAIEATAVEAIETAIVHANNRLGMFKNAPGGKLPEESKTFMHTAGEKVPGWDVYKHAIGKKTLADPLAIPPKFERNKLNQMRKPALVVDDDDLLGDGAEASEREIAEAAGAVSEVDDLLG